MTDKQCTDHMLDECLTRSLDPAGSAPAADDSDVAIDWLLRLRQLQGQGMDFDTALAQANAEADKRST